MEQPILLFGWFRWDILVEYKDLFWQGAWMTLRMTVVCVLLGSSWGLCLALARLAQPRHAPWTWVARFFLRWPATVYVSFFRGTPLFVQILLIHFAVMPVFIHPTSGILIDGELARTLKQEHGALISGVVALTLNSAAYISEVFRAGIQSISRGQFDAGRSIGFSPAQVMRYVVLPQAFRRMLPPLGNNAIALLKDTSLVSAIGLAELAYAARTVAGAYARYWEPYLAISVVYWVMTLVLTTMLRRLEHRLARSDRG
ncbi:polar amino acid transport system permease protein [Variovorax boronicumulans]|uniref:amino acid ABC transporter permease n=1 Tax=Variovorax TaxID=34072 RepID=UPI0021515667|nr:MULTISPECIES: amino acid ABC transporter permease [Variovorax]MCR6479143.1 amino acid ABC transporter permease [Variovorax sp. ZS18.2.2]MDH6167319.1 polar amino acid transport system permease protein [Variovorax boronicumulans]